MYIKMSASAAAAGAVPQAQPQPVVVRHISRVYNSARQTCLEMMRDRGYTFNISGMTNVEFEQIFDKKGLMDLKGIRDEKGKPVYVRFVESMTPLAKGDEIKQDVFDPLKHDVDAKNADEVVSKCNKGEFRIIVVFNARSADGTQPSSKHKLEKDYEGKSGIELFQVHLLSVNPVKHRYQPKFRLISDKKEIEQIYAYYDAKPILFGSICIDDPVNRYYNGQPGQLYEITREGTGIFYRKVTSKYMNCNAKKE